MCKELPFWQCLSQSMEGLCSETSSENNILGVLKATEKHKVPMLKQWLENKASDRDV